MLFDDVIPKVIRVDRFILAENEKYCSRKYCPYFVGFGINRYPFCNLFQAKLHQFDGDKVKRCDECSESKVIFDKGNVPPLVELHREKKQPHKQKFQIGDYVKIINGKHRDMVGKIIRIDDYRRETWEKKRIRKEYTIEPTGNKYWPSLFCCLSYQLERKWSNRAK
jgi:hypothetical protein